MSNSSMTSYKDSEAVDADNHSVCSSHTVISNTLMDDYAKYRPESDSREEYSSKKGVLIMQDLPALAANLAVLLSTSLKSLHDGEVRDSSGDRIKRMKMRNDIKCIANDCESKKNEIRKMMARKMPKSDVEKKMIELKVLQNREREMKAAYEATLPENESLLARAEDILNMPQESELRAKLISVLNSF